MIKNRTVFIQKTIYYLTLMLFVFTTTRKRVKHVVSYPKCRKETVALEPVPLYLEEQACFQCDIFYNQQRQG